MTIIKQYKPDNQTADSHLTSKAQDRAKIRIKIRHERNQLSTQFQREASKSLAEQLIHLPSIQSANTFALYLANDGELDPNPFINWCWQQQKQVVLPILHPFKKGHLLFLKYSPSTLMKKNRFDISEPALDVTNVVPIADIDVIFTPLVAFDKTGQRLGMGGGFYDRTLANVNSTVRGISIIGLAHDCQEVEQVPIEPWDIPIPQIVTPSRMIAAVK